MAERDPSIMALGAKLRGAAKEVDQDEWDELESQLEVDSGFTNSTQYETWRPEDKAGFKPTARYLKPATGKELPTWEDYLIEENFDQDWILLGAGAEALKHARDIDGHLVYGINWTTRWFPPTFLQAIDGQVWQEEIRTPRVKRCEKETQIVASRNLVEARSLDEEDRARCLQFEIIHPALKRNYERQQFAEGPKEILSWAPNSLFFALNILHWFRPRRIAMVGFDFGGPHFFGDGRQAGAACDYGFKSHAKRDLHERLRWMRREMEKRGNTIRQVGQTKLDVFHQVDSIDEALA